MQLVGVPPPVGPRMHGRRRGREGEKKMKKKSKLGPDGTSSIPLADMERKERGLGEGWRKKRNTW